MQCSLAASYHYCMLLVASVKGCALQLMLLPQLPCALIRSQPLCCAQE